ncbi:MAG: hypothetical protein K9J16_08750 [Melioribacteraceae bacterium]|nr:hypothetical protein [Melioribacteraceae bacterium]MCF8353992.1 hypothetical protein [Melioribacteraceae bacterium]MCF8393720.1 hypothetical protein [Melioribacteraceae bacterium]MCF8419538.1 hypothetical protein [Melioribacteraceae bacterium]
MAKVQGLGGLFFKCSDPKKLSDWYNKYLGIKFSEWSSAEFKPSDYPGNGFTVFAPFKADTDYFNPSKKEFMINLIIDDVAEGLKQVKEGGAEIIGEIQRFDYGDFGWFIDPEGNKVELWKPAENK